MIELRDLAGKVLYTAKGAADVRAALVEAVARGADLRGAYLGGAYLGGANLGDANLRGANLRGADLRGAYLGGANLGDANLGDANLRGADLRGAKGLNPLVTTPLHMLYDQPGAIRAYKLVNHRSEGPQYGGIAYKVGGSYEVGVADEDPCNSCGAGINLATLDWCLANWVQGYRVLVAEFTAADIAAIPHGSDGKFRVRRCRIVGEKSLDELGLLPQPETEAVAS